MYLKEGICHMASDDLFPNGTVTIMETWGNDRIDLYGPGGKAVAVSDGDPSTVADWCHEHDLQLQPFDKDFVGYGWWIDFRNASERILFKMAWDI